VVMFDWQRCQRALLQAFSVNSSSTDDSSRRVKDLSTELKALIKGKKLLTLHQLTDRRTVLEYAVLLLGCISTPNMVRHDIC